MVLPIALFSCQQLLKSTGDGLLERNIGNPSYHLFPECKDESFSCGLKINTTSLEIEQLIFFKVTDGSTMRTLDIICDDLEVRL